MPWSNNGTVQVSSGGTIATGTGTTFLSSARVGDALTIAGSTSLHEVTAIASDTQLTFQPPYTGTEGSGKAYRIAPIMGYDKDLSDEFNSIRLQWGAQLSSLQPWATAATADIALSNLGGSQTGTAVFKGSPADGRAALELGNTTVDANGFIKKASPIIKLHADRIETDAVGTFERIGMGHYRIIGCNGLRLTDGWYIETPHDRNGNKYFNVEWEQDTEPNADTGVLEESANVALTIRCYERVWNPATGLHENGEPADILAGRWIDLRMNEVRMNEVRQSEPEQKADE